MDTARLATLLLCVVLVAVPVSAWRWRNAGNESERVARRDTALLLVSSLFALIAVLARSRFPLASKPFYILSALLVVLCIPVLCLAIRLWLVYSAQRREQARR